MTTPSGLTRIAGVPDSGEVPRGMAYFPGTGPYDKTCGDCAHRGYQRETRTGSWDAQLQAHIFGAYRYYGCAKFKALAGKHGPEISQHNRSCKYFEPQT